MKLVDGENEYDLNKLKRISEYVSFRKEIGDPISRVEVFNRIRGFESAGKGKSRSISRKIKGFKLLGRWMVELTDKEVKQWNELVNKQKK